MKIFTMGFTKKSAEQFFSRLKQTGLKRVVDTRLNNVSQLAGFTKKDDLRFFLKTVLDIDYVHAPMLAPNKDILDEYKKNGGDWSAYERKFLELMGSRHIESNIDRNLLDGACLLCSEPTPHHCHRRLVAEYLKEKWGDVEIKHL
ncbi:MAG: hypothetical protein ABS96_29460 [Lysobacteraceae bacterium SCN 69-123]|nr:MAG: hypothetical protein ABS96_29460 [Xanthomonadaceae bacterium SCN 69-123]